MANPIVGDRFFFVNAPARRGGTATVRKARDLRTDDLVAVKLFDGQNIEDELLKEIYLRDKEALTALKHPNIARIIECV